MLSSLAPAGLFGFVRGGGPDMILFPALGEGNSIMQRWTSYTLRAVFIIGFLIVLPVMAMPSVAKLLDGLLYGEPEKSGPTTGAEPAPAPNTSSVAEASQATHEVPLPSEGAALHE